MHYYHAPGNNDCYSGCIKPFYDDDDDDDDDDDECGVWMQHVVEIYKHQ